MGIRQALWLVIAATAMAAGCAAVGQDGPSPDTAHEMDASDGDGEEPREPILAATAAVVVLDELAMSEETLVPAPRRHRWVGRVEHVYWQAADQGPHPLGEGDEVLVRFDHGIPAQDGPVPKEMDGPLFVALRVAAPSDSGHWSATAVARRDGELMWPRSRNREWQRLLDELGGFDEQRLADAARAQSGEAMRPGGAEGGGHQERRSLEVGPDGRLREPASWGDTYHFGPPAADRQPAITREVAFQRWQEARAYADAPEHASGEEVFLASFEVTGGTGAGRRVSESADLVWVFVYHGVTDVASGPFGRPPPTPVEHDILVVVDAQSGTPLHVLSLPPRT